MQRAEFGVDVPPVVSYVAEFLYFMWVGVHGFALVENQMDYCKPLFPFGYKKTPPQRGFDWERVGLLLDRTAAHNFNFNASVFIATFSSFVVSNRLGSTFA